MAVSAGNIVSLATKPVQYGRILHFGIDKVRHTYTAATTMRMRTAQGLHMYNCHTIDREGAQSPRRLAASISRGPIAWTLIKSCSLSWHALTGGSAIGMQVVSADGDHGTGWFDVQRLPEELWAGAPPKRMPLRRLAEVYSEQEAVPLMKQELLKVSDPVLQCGILPCWSKPFAHFHSAVLKLLVCNWMCRLT